MESAPLQKSLTNRDQGVLFKRILEPLGTVGVDPVFPEFGFYLPFSD